MNAQHQPWRIHLQAKAKNFQIKFEATRYLPACYNFFQFSIFLKIYSLIIRVSSDNHPPTRRKSLKSSITGFVYKFWTKRKIFTAYNPSKIKKSNSEGPICGSTSAIGNIGSLIQSFIEKDFKGMIVHCFSMLLFLIKLLKTFIRTKNNKLMLILMLSMVGYCLWLYMINNLSYGGITFAWRCFRNVWN